MLHTGQDLDCNVSLAQGAPLLALDYANDETLTLRNECFKAWMAIAKQHKSSGHCCRRLAQATGIAVNILDYILDYRFD